MSADDFKEERDDAELLVRWLMLGGEISDISVSGPALWSLSHPRRGVNEDDRCPDNGRGIPRLNQNVRQSLRYDMS